MDRKMSRPTETPVALLQGSAGPSQCKSTRMGTGDLLGLGVLVTPVEVQSRQLPRSGRPGCGGSAVAVLVVVAALAFAAVVGDAAGAAAAAMGFVGASSPRDSANPLREAILRWSEAIIACSAVGGGRAVGRIHLPPCAPWNGSDCVPPAR